MFDAKYAKQKTKEALQPDSVFVKSVISAIEKEISIFLVLPVECF